MQSLMETTFYGNTALEWLIALGIVVLALLLGKTVYWVFQNVVRRLTAKTKTKLDDIVLDMIEEPIVVILTVLGFWLAVNTLTIESAKVYEFLSHAMQAAITLSVAWLFARLVDSIIQEYLVPLADRTESDLDDQLLPVLRKGAKLTIWVIGVIIALNNAGYDVAALLAGLGVGGLALAIAAQDTVANIFGGVTIFADRPFVIGDRVRVEGFDGHIKDIGVRSSRLETRDGSIVTIPNSAFASSAVENVTAGENGRRIVLTLGLTYDTTADEVETACSILREIAASTEGVGDDVVVTFSGFGDFALEVRFAYFVVPGAQYRLVEGGVNLEVLRRFNAEGLDFAFPTQHIYTQAVESAG